MPRVENEWPSRRCNNAEGWSEPVDANEWEEVAFVEAYGLEEEVES